ncbi:MAG TPA: hypothetical protein VJK02_22600 [Anaerolineales bacterium]|nr:hypothetical protein [Anaerolineales bacterium]
MMKKTIALVLLGMAFVIAGCSSVPPTDGPTQASPPTASSPSPAAQEALKGCVPACVQGLVRPGPLPAGEYQTQWFFGGRMQVTLDGDWTSGEDSSGEFKLSPKDSDNDLSFWEDVYSVENGVRVESVPMTATGLLDWLSTNPRLKTTSPVAGHIGKAIPAAIVDVTNAEGAPNDDPECPFDTCVLFLGFPQWDDVWGLAGPQVVRFYLADVSYGGASHLFVAVIYPDDPADMVSFRALAEPVIASVQVPADPQ